ncbi:MAG: MBL fold metallo-hydrolase [Acidimicrobiales bacterium]
MLIEAYGRTCAGPQARRRPASTRTTVRPWPSTPPGSACDRDYAKGLIEIADGCFAYLQPDGGWCLSNAGLLAGKGGSLLVDTLTDVPRTAAMLEAMKPVTTAAPIRTLAITHGNLDHYFGNQLVEGAEIVASVGTAHEMATGPTPASMAAMVANPDPVLGAYLRHAFGQFDWSGIELTMPTRTFEDRLTIDAGGRRAELIDVGPAHTAGDTICHLPDDRVAFTGDLLFIFGTPIVWAGPYENWYRACDVLLSLDCDVYVPGHGPLTDRRGVEGVKAYLQYVYAEARARFDAGLDARDAAFDIDLGPYAEWNDSERLAINVLSAYREFDPNRPEAGRGEVFALMAELAGRHR